MRLSVTQGIEILMIVGYGDIVRTQQEVVELFNTKYPDRPITQSAVNKVEKKFRDIGSVDDCPKAGRPLINEQINHPDRRMQFCQNVNGYVQC